MADRRPNLESLELQIEHNRVEAVGGRSFVPPSCLSAIFTHAAVVAAVAELRCEAEERLTLVEGILNSGMSTFAILISVGQPDMIVNFRRQRCLGRLPLDQTQAERAAGRFATAFLRQQWDFLPYHFRPGEDVDIGKVEILPFIHHHGRLTSGAFGDIDTLEIYPTLQNFYSHETGQVVVVRKTLRKDPAFGDGRLLKLYNNEKRCLLLCNRPSHPNIVPLLSSYVYDGDYCMLFPRLDMDLETFLSQQRPYGSFRWKFTYFSALRGLASALARVHTVRLRAKSEGVDFDGVGYHHDLRPANVLVSAETLVLADFGMGRVKPQHDGSMTRFKALASDYVGPECMDEEFTHLDVGRAMDVWAFGCLVAELMTYAYLGADGLRKFRAARKSLGSSGFITDSFFHNGKGRLKPAVVDWIDTFTAEELRSAIGGPLKKLVLSVLTPIDRRPKISYVYLRLAHLSLKSHFSAVMEALAETLSNDDESPIGGSLMKLWFERERLRAFGTAQSLMSDDKDLENIKFAEVHGEMCEEKLRELFHKLPQPPKRDEGQESDVVLHDVTSAAARPTNPSRQIVTGAQVALEEDAQRLIQELWNLLSESESRKAQRYWVHSMLDSTDNIEQLSLMEKKLSTERPVVYQEGAALAMMKKIRLEMMNDLDRVAELDGLEIGEGDIPVVDSKAIHGHCLGVYKNDVRVLVESIYYDVNWEKIPPHERILIIADKVRGFSVSPRPASLRLLDCLGFFELGKRGGQKGYSFVYQFPEAPPDLSLEVKTRSVTTLLGLLTRSLQPRPEQHSRTDPYAAQPVLGDKFRLATMLAGFLAEFHTTGWLHENFHSNNIVYPNVVPDNVDPSPSAAMSGNLWEPFIVGLKKSRPGGESWHTQGPTDEMDVLDYHHPAYEQTKHFRVGYDYYSLGIILLEIGLWTPLYTISKKKEFKTLSPTKLRDVLLERYVPRLGYKMGQTYRDVVMLLLDDSLDQDPLRATPTAEGEKQAFSKFLERVVNPLEVLGHVNL